MSGLLLVAACLEVPLWPLYSGTQLRAMIQ